MSNDVIVEVKLKDEQGNVYRKCVSGNLLLIYADEIIIFENTADMVGTKYPLEKMESLGVVGKYDKEGRECEHYSVSAGRLMEDKEVS
jgi:hypothetical protein